MKRPFFVSSCCYLFLRDFLPATTSPLPAITNVSSIPLTLLPVLGFVLPALFLAGVLLSVALLSVFLLFVLVPLLFELVSLLSECVSLLSELVSFAYGVIVRSVMTHKVPSEPSLVSFS